MVRIKKIKYQQITVMLFSVVMLVVFPSASWTANVTLPTKKVSVYKTQVAFKNSAMTSAKTIQFPSYQRIGVIVGDIIDLKAIITPSQVVPDSKLIWTGIQAGVGPDRSIIINNIGGGIETLTVADKVNVMTIITAFDVSGPTENEWAVTHPVAAAALYLDAGDAVNMAVIANSDNNWGDPNIHNGRADAARHSYWNVLMAFNSLVGPLLAQEAGLAHERTNLNANAPHNEIVMDLINNMKGIWIANSLPSNASLADQKTAVVNAINSGGNMILDDLSNTNKSGLLQPSNQ